MTSLIERAHLLNHKVGIFPIYDYWKDIGSLEGFNQVADKKKKVLIFL